MNTREYSPFEIAGSYAWIKREPWIPSSKRVLRKFLSLRVRCVELLRRYVCFAEPETDGETYI